MKLRALLCFWIDKGYIASQTRLIIVKIEIYVISYKLKYDNR